MQRHQLESLLLAAARVVDVDDLVVIGSQAILGSLTPGADPPHEAIRSVEADLAVDPLVARRDGLDPTELADRIDGAIGELSHLHRTRGYYAQGVEVETAVLVDGWRDRLVPLVADDGERRAVGWCLERHDLWIAKAAAGRAKDLEFCRALVEHGLVDLSECQTRAALLPEPHRTRVAGIVDRSAGESDHPTG
jgi:hypothetical protein